MIANRLAAAAAGVLLSLLLAGSAGAAPPGPPGPAARCAVCGMFVAPYPTWVSVIEFKDGSTAYFDGPRDMFVYFFDLGRYRPGATVADVRALYATEYYTMRLVPLTEVFLVSGSDVLGPMGNELVPVAGRERAETFLKDHVGQKILQFNGGELVEVLVRHD